MVDEISRVCAVCGKTYTDYPAISRKDNKTEICPECGMREALESIGVNGEEQNRIVETVNDAVWRVVRRIPCAIYRGAPCSVVAVGTALGYGNAQQDQIRGLFSDKLKGDGYLSLDAMNALIRSNLTVTKRETYARGKRPQLRTWARKHKGQRAVVCVEGHYLYFDGQNYWSFLFNASDAVVTAWLLD